MNEKIKSIIKANLEGYGLEKIILFGSRARGDCDADSDYDLYIVLKNDMVFAEKSHLTDLLLEKLAEEDICADIIISNQKNLDEYRKYPDNVSKYVTEEGIEI